MGAKIPEVLCGPLFGLPNRRLDAAITIGLVLLLLASRLAALPASIWEQDEAYLAVAVVDFDPIANHPHPPWFPLWVALGKTVHLFDVEPAFALQLASLIFGVWILFPLTALWSRLLSRKLAVFATILFLALPGPWLFAGRAFSGTAATAFLTAALAVWLAPQESRRSLAIGSCFAAIAVLIRPHIAVGFLFALPLIWNRTPATQRAQLVVPGALILGAGAFCLAIAAGGAGPLFGSLQAHAAYHFEHLREADRSLSSSGLSKSLGSVFPAILWLLFFAIGAIRSSLEKYKETLLILAALLPLTATTWLLADPGHARYFVPLLALSSGFVIRGLAVFSKRLTPLAVALTVGAAALSVWPDLQAYKIKKAPTLRALHAGYALVSGEEALCVDRRLVAFVEYQTTTEGPVSPVLFDHVIKFEKTTQLPEACAAAVLAADHEGLNVSSGTRHRFSTSARWLRMLTREEFSEVTVLGRENN